MILTADILRAATGCTPAAAALFAPHLASACKAYQINTPDRLAAFLAEVGHESGSLRYVREIASGQAYEGRASLGNTQPGDGPRYRGRGLIQVTGRRNYRAAAQRMSHLGAPDFEQEPEALEQPQWAAMSAADYWHNAGLNALADAGELDDIGSLINTGRRGRVPNGAADRQRRHRMAAMALQVDAVAPPAVEAPTPAPMDSTPIPLPAEDQQPETMPQEHDMPLATFAAAALPHLIQAIPLLGRLFGSGSEVAERNVKAASMAVQLVQDAVGARNAQEAVEIIKADPAAAEAAQKAVQDNWLALSESGGGGIEGARKADAAAAARGDLLQSPSFWIAAMLLPLVYLLVLSLIGMIGSATWSDDVRAGLAGSLMSAIVGGLVGYYYGQTTSRNRSAAQ